MFERFTDRARRVVVLAQEEARMLNHNYIGTEHEVPRASRTGDPLGSFSEKVRARASESTEVLPGVQR